MKPIFKDFKFWLLFSIGILYFSLVYWFRWISSDGLAVTYQTKNVLNGLGMVWNYGERSFVSTSPLYSLLSIPLTFLLEKIGFNDLPLQNIPIVINMIFSLLAFGIILKFVWTKNLSAAKLYFCTGIFLLALCSDFFIHFSTSGLENSLSYLILSLFGVSVYSEKESTEKKSLPLYIALAFLTRYDFFLIIFPTVLYLLNKYRFKSLPILVSLLIPITLWLGFALLYFGSIFPNSFYMKAGFLGIENSLGYFSKNVVRSPLMTILIGIGFWGAYKTYKPLFWGMVIYFFYTIYVTDYMFGRFWTNLVPLCIVAAIQYCSLYINRISLKDFKPVLYSIIIISLCFITNQKFKDSIYLVNERKYYTERADLMHEHLSYTPPFNNTIERCDKIDIRGGAALHIPLNQMARKKKCYYVDVMGLATPFTTYFGKNYGIKGERPGHFEVNIKLLDSVGFKTSLMSGQNTITNKGIHQLYDDMKLITKGDLFSKERLEAIVRLHTIKYNEIR